MLSIEFEEPETGTCECCGNKTVRLSRFVYKDGDAFAIYYAKFTAEHTDKVVTGIISIGDWDEEADPNNRRAFPFRIWTNETNYQVGLLDKEDSPWQGAILGKILDRTDALAHPWIGEVFHITDHIVTEDEQIIRYLA